jgi:hypothetical protein
MTVPSLDKPIIQFEMRPLLSARVTLYTSSKEARQRIVEKTILIATSNPGILADEDIEASLYQLLHSTAVQELQINSNRFQPSSERPFFAPGGQQCKVSIGTFRSKLNPTNSSC